MESSRWLIRTPGPARRLRLYCFPYAGGSAAAYADWQAGLPADIEVCAVQPPGRGARFIETPVDSLAQMLEALTPAFLASADRPFAFFGHSLGALVAFEFTRHLARLRLPQPVHLFVSGCQAPQWRDPARGLHLLGDEALIEVLRDYNGTPPEVLADRELLALLLPMIRADFSLAETYRYQPGARLAVPVTALAGRGEAYRLPEQVLGWQDETSAAFSSHWFDGDHFFLNPRRDAVLATIARAIGLQAPAPAEAALQP